MSTTLLRNALLVTLGILLAAPLTMVMAETLGNARAEPPKSTAGKKSNDKDQAVSRQRSRMMTGGRRLQSRAFG